MLNISRVDRNDGPMAITAEYRGPHDDRAPDGREAQWKVDKESLTRFSKDKPGTLKGAFHF